ncbi:MULTISPECIES: YqjF family protein [Pontibacillus]|uniref:DUF2071 domain-containing protein n=1 Tax=Pontibacillus chungwhensis TaxID=265426 RepID=A0ABY8V0W6_9BACI|nr:MULTISPECIES: DUF2071 domain-containing protein [Pontibacillus]MCD5322294.1 DUF2071 domain-containing protein [Pontibacillus sp. HN14]WIF99587.1 DUF2071 domain-containing protein [Pontibacillus chungwhensis]
MKKSWIMKQDWNDLIFIHWPVKVDDLRPHVPDCFDIDTYEGWAWIAIVPFQMKNIQLRGLPPVPGFNQLLELNVRTYVTYNGEPGVYFYTLDANHLIGVGIARYVFGLNYVTARMSLDQQDGTYHFLSRRTHTGYPPAHFHARYKPVSPVLRTQPGSLMYWLTERYALWVNRGKRIYKGPIFHQNWQLQKAEVEMPINDLTDFLPSSVFDRKPVAYFSKNLHTSIFPFERYQ